LLVGAGIKSWTLLQSTNVALPMGQWQTNAAGSFDGNGNLSTNFLSTPPPTFRNFTSSEFNK
jgi:hypothetical protein